MSNIVKVACPHCRIIADEYRRGFCDFCLNLRVKDGILTPGERERIAREVVEERVRSWRERGEEWMMVWGSVMGPSPTTLIAALFPEKKCYE